MAGIVATSQTTNNLSTTTPDGAVTGYITGEEIVLTTTPVGSSYSWTLSAPSTERAVLSSETEASTRFKPRNSGTYLIVCQVDGTTYILRISVAEVGSVISAGPVRLMPLLKAAVPAPASGISWFFSEDDGQAAGKYPDGSVYLFPGRPDSGVTTIPFAVGVAPAYQEGLLFYDSEDHTLGFYDDQDGTLLNIGTELRQRVVNKTGSDIPNAKVVYINGGLGNRPTIALADAATVDPMRTIGMTTHAIANNAEGWVAVGGTVDGDTSAFTTGEILWLSPTTPGEMTHTKPTAPDARVSCAIPVNSTVSGRFLVQMKVDFS